MTPWGDGFLLSLSLCMDIGIVNIAMITLTMQRGYWPGFWLGLGSCIGDLIYAIVALAGMTALLQFASVRWVMWIGGGAAMLWFAWKMLRSAWRSTEPAMPPAGQPARHGRQLLKGMLLALSSPSAIIWFAVVGGALVAKSGGGGGWNGTGLFLLGFFSAGLVWTLMLCTVASKGSQVVGRKMLTASYVASSLLFLYFAYQVIVHGYQTLILQAPVPLT